MKETNLEKTNFFLSHLNTALNLNVKYDVAELADKDGLNIEEAKEIESYILSLRSSQIAQKLYQPEIHLTIADSQLTFIPFCCHTEETSR